MYNANSDLFAAWKSLGSARYLSLAVFESLPLTFFEGRDGLSNFGGDGMFPSASCERPETLSAIGPRRLIDKR